jgi:hypothetical protein
MRARECSRIEATCGNGSVQARAFRELPLCVEVAVAHGGQLVGQVVVTLGDLGTRFEDGSLPERFGGTLERRHRRCGQIAEQRLLLGDEGGGPLGSGA